MEEERTRIIIEEIEKWKKGKLLPEMYCEYLLALYTKGESKNSIKKNDIRLILPLLIQVCLLLASIFIIYSHIFTFTYQIIILAIILSIASFVHYKCKDNMSLYFIFTVFITLIIILLITIFIGQEVGNTHIVSIIFLVNFIVWFIVSRRYRSKFLLIISIFATIFTILYIIF